MMLLLPLEVLLLLIQRLLLLPVPPSVTSVPLRTSSSSDSLVRPVRIMCPRSERRGAAISSSYLASSHVQQPPVVFLPGGHVADRAPRAAAPVDGILSYWFEGWSSGVVQGRGGSSRVHRIVSVVYQLMGA